MRLRVSLTGQGKALGHLLKKALLHASVPAGGAAALVAQGELVGTAAWMFAPEVALQAYYFAHELGLVPELRLRPRRIAAAPTLDVKSTGAEGGRACALRVFRGQPSYQDVRQGQLGDCYLLAALAAVAAADRQFIRRLFCKIVACDGDTSAGTLAVAIYGKGRWHAVPVLNELYVSTNATAPLFADVDHGGGWVALYERGYAALFGRGTYAKVNGGLTGEGLKQVTGMQVRGRILGQASSFMGQDLYSVLSEASRAGRPMVAGTNHLRVRDPGLISRHVYCVMGTGTDCAGRYVELYNPHGLLLRVPFDVFCRDFHCVSWIHDFRSRAAAHSSKIRDALLTLTGAEVA